MAETLRDYYNTGNDDIRGITDTTWYGQTFLTTEDYLITKVKLLLYRSGTPGTVTVSIRATSAGLPTGADLTSGTTNGDTLTEDSGGEWRAITFSSSYLLNSSTTYAIVIRSEAAGLRWNCDSSSPSYAGGSDVHSVDSGANWDVTTSNDFMFETWGIDNIPTDKVYSKKIVAIANNELWYESTAGTMAELAAANGGISTSNPLTIVEAFQKLFIANKNNLKVADFINTKIATDNVGTHPPDPGTILTGGTSGAKMVVDYITSTTADAACTIYGKRTTTATFSSGETVTGTDDDSNSISFATSAAETAPPHWYDWTVFGQDSAFGTMPDSAYLVCRYRGRLVLSGNPNYPHQWYMSKIGFPFNFLYGTNDPMTAVAGTNADAGELGDIVRALIPFGDDFLIFACANSIHLLDGDPVSGGSIDELDNKTGIFGPWAWCKDGVGNLWFYGTGGLYKMTGGRSRPINVSISHLPKLVTDWEAVPGTHRVVLTYDPFRNGIIISRTTLADGTNLNYWYDLKTEGFYPETYPAACGIFSSAYYDSDAAGTKGLVLGCNDGYIRNFYDASKDDDSGASNTAISSYVTWPIEHLAEDNDKEGLLTSLVFELHKANDAETCLEKIKDGDTPFSSGTLSGTGRKNRIRTRVRAAYLGLKLSNSTESETWSINRIFGTVREVGKIK